MLAECTSNHEQWGGSSPNFLLFRALLQTAGAATLARLFPQVATAALPCLENHEGEPNLRLSMLQLFDELLEDDLRVEQVRRVQRFLNYAYCSY